MKEYIIEKDVRRLPFAIKIEKENTNFTNFGRAVERERSELRNASPKERKSQWKNGKKWNYLCFGTIKLKTLEWRAIMLWGLLGMIPLKYHMYY